MASISANGTDVNRSTPPSIPVIAGYLNIKILDRFQMAILFKRDDGEYGFTPSAVRGNAAYAYQRRERYEEYQRAINHLARIDTHRQTTNAFFITLTYPTSHINPPQSVITAFRRRLKAKGVQEAIIVGESHKRGYIHHHGVIITDQPLKYFHLKPTKKNPKETHRSTKARRIVRESWGEGHIDCQAIITPGGAGGYVMKELLKQAQCERALRKYNRGGMLTAGEEMQLRTLYWAKRYRRRLVSVSPRLSKLGKLPDDVEAAVSTALFNTCNNPTLPNAVIIPRTLLWAIFTRHGRAPPRYTGDRITDSKIIAEIDRIAAAQQG